MGAVHLIAWDSHHHNVVTIGIRGTSGEWTLLSGGWPRFGFSNLTTGDRYEADHVFALPTIAFFMSAIGLFIIGNVLSQVLDYRTTRRPIWRRTLGAVRYLSYRGFHLKLFGWNSAPVGVLLLGAAGTIFFFSESYVSPIHL